MHNIVQQYENINEQIFSVYIAEDAQGAPAISLGSWCNCSIFQPDKNEIKWVDIPDDESIEYYYYWRVPVGMINVMNVRTQENRNIHMTSDRAIISY